MSYGGWGGGRGNAAAMTDDGWGNPLPSSNGQSVEEWTIAPAASSAPSNEPERPPKQRTPTKQAAAPLTAPVITTASNDDWGWGWGTPAAAPATAAPVASAPSAAPAAQVDEQSPVATPQQSNDTNDWSAATNGTAQSVSGWDSASAQDGTLDASVASGWDAAPPSSHANSANNSRTEFEPRGRGRARGNRGIGGGQRGAGRGRGRGRARGGANSNGWDSSSQTSSSFAPSQQSAPSRNNENVDQGWSNNAQDGWGTAAAPVISETAPKAPNNDSVDGWGAQPASEQKASTVETTSGWDASPAPVPSVSASQNDWGSGWDVPASSTAPSNAPEATTPSVPAEKAKDQTAPTPKLDWSSEEPQFDISGATPPNKNVSESQAAADSTSSSLAPPSSSPQTAPTPPIRKARSPMMASKWANAPPARGRGRGGAGRGRGGGGGGPRRDSSSTSSYGANRAQEASSSFASTGSDVWGNVEDVSSQMSSMNIQDTTAAGSGWDQGGGGGWGVPSSSVPDQPSNSAPATSGWGDDDAVVAPVAESTPPVQQDTAASGWDNLGPTTPTKPKPTPQKSNGGGGIDRAQRDRAIQNDIDTSRARNSARKMASMNNRAWDDGKMSNDWESRSSAVESYPSYSARPVERNDAGMIVRDGPLENGSGGGGQPPSSAIKASNADQAAWETVAQPEEEEDQQPNDDPASMWGAPNPNSSSSNIVTGW